MKIKEPIFTWDDKDGVAIYKMFDDHNRCFIGIAECTPEDEDMKSEKTGYEIASRRAEVDLLEQHIKDLKWEKRILNDLLKTYKNHPKYNTEDWEYKILQRKIWNLELDIETFKNIAKVKRLDIDSLIRMKEGFYQKIRKARDVQIKTDHPRE